jgi:prepilin-type processing-associated H-X9-DG protein/prepilin-type N-terminal cleavage/methylation domain-containing protein
MNRHRISSRRAFTWIELIVVLVILAVVFGLLLPSVECAREAARRAQCCNNLKHLSLGLHNYHTANRVFPPGTICSTAPVQPSNQYDVLTEAANTATGFHGTSWILRTLPYLECSTACRAWNFQYAVCWGSLPTNANLAGGGNVALASMDVRGMYCPTRRQQFRQGIDAPMFPTVPGPWTGGGTDYGGCAGRHAAFTLATGYNLCDATMYYEPGFFPSPFKGEADDTPAKRWGIFGRVNVSTTDKEIADGQANTIIIGELQRITDITPGSKDGWAIGGPATLFTTGALMRRNGTTVVNLAKPSEGSLMNNGFFGSPGSEHSGGANFGMVDGSVQFISQSVDANIFALLGSMDDGVAVTPESD